MLAGLRLSGAGESVRINASDADSCCDMGWVVLHNRRYVLTASGRAISVL